MTVLPTVFFMSINTCMNDKDAVKKLIKRAKKHPSLYSTLDVKYAKMIRKQYKKDGKTKAKEE